MSATRLPIPGVMFEELLPAPFRAFVSGIPVFVGVDDRPTATTAVSAGLQTLQPAALTDLDQFEQAVQVRPLVGELLTGAVRAFYANGGGKCYVLLLEPQEGQRELAQLDLSQLEAGFEVLETLDDNDLVCLPDLMRAPEQAVRLQQATLDFCRRINDRFALLDSPPGADPAAAVAQRRRLSGENGALYYPWIRLQSRDVGYVPPCGHVAGVIARCDRATGVHKAPANEVLFDTIDTERSLTPSEQADLYAEGINFVRAFPGRGLRVWGAQTLAADALWRQISVRRLVLNLARWVERNLAPVGFEPNEWRLWSRVDRQLRSYLGELFRRGALQGASADEAFFVHCDATTNPSEVRGAGQVIAEIGIAPASPAEFIIVRIVQEESGTTVIGPQGPL